MTGPEFKEWQKRMGWSAAEAGRRLEKSSDTIATYRRDGTPGVVTDLACMAMEAGIKCERGQLVRP